MSSTLHFLPKLPLLPGFIIHKPRENNHLRHCFLHLNGTGLAVVKDSTDKDWPFNNEKILCFKAHSCESNDGDEMDQNRPVKLLYFLEDETIQVIELRMDPSGKPIRVCIVKRQQIPRDASENGEFLTQQDLNVKKRVKILGQTYEITDCDHFTRRYLNEAGVQVPEKIQAPNEYDHWTNENTWQPKKTIKPPKEETKHQKFLNYESSRLRFDAYWDDRESKFGEIHDLVVIYYLFDQTIQISEMPKNEKPFTFYKRLKLPKKTSDVFSLGQKPNPLVLGDTLLEKCVKDRSDHRHKCDVDFYTETDLRIGKTLNVFGRKVVLIDCDDFTRNFLREKYGIEDFTPIERPKDSRFSRVEVEKKLPPYNGWGSLEDSESSCHSVVELKPPKKISKNFLQKNNIKLRFKARLLSKTEDNDRLFLMTFHLDDDTISVHEISDKSCKEFVRRSKFYLPHQCLFTNHRPESYTSQMMYIGANVELNRHIFYLIDADEFTLNFMETNATDYPMANIDSVLEKIRGALCSIDYKTFFCKYLGEVPVRGKSIKSDTLKLCHKTTAMALRELLGKEATEHEIVTFLRYFDVDKSAEESENYNRSTVQAMVQRALKNRIWDDLETLKHHIERINPMKPICFIQQDKLCAIMKACRLPIQKLLMNHMLFVLKKDTNGCIDVKDFLDFVDVHKYQAPRMPNGSYNDSKKEFESSERPKVVDWGAFLSELGFDGKSEEKTD